MLDGIDMVEVNPSLIISLVNGGAGGGAAIAEAISSSSISRGVPCCMFSSLANSTLEILSASRVYQARHDVCACGRMDMLEGKPI